MGVTPRPVNTAVTTLNPLVFIKEVARYFMDFLETDFHKQKTPKRAVRFRNPDNLLVGVSADKYANQQSAIQDLVTVEMTYLLDGRVIDFYEQNRATAKALRDIIRSKQRFPKEEFGRLKKAFPCILAGIRDYAEYIPLQPEIFDLLIIDEASQVSIAQAFPALLRAKKILILGDKKQFSNIKAAQARSDTNREYLNSLMKPSRRTYLAI
jgi:hypothetical protein